MNKRLTKFLKTNREAIIQEWTKNQLSDDLLERWQISWAKAIETAELQKHFVTPLYDLLLEHIEKKDDNYRLIYLDERLRYAPFNIPQAKRCEYFQAVLELDKNSICSRIKAADLLEFTSSLWDELHSQLVTEAVNPLSILAVGDCLMNEIRVFLPAFCQAHQTDIDMRYIYFSAAMNEPLSAGEISDYLKNNKVDLIAMSFFTFEGIALYSILLRECDTLVHSEIDSRVKLMLNQANALIQEVRKQTNTTLMIHNVSGLPLTRYRRLIPTLPALSSKKTYLLKKLNQGISQLVESTTNTILLDENAVSQKIGLKKLSGEVISRKLSKAGYFHTSKLAQPLSVLYGQEVLRYQAVSKKKLLLIDFDGTLWKGVMADGEVKHFKDRQEILKKLTEVGIMLAAVSKNSESNIRWDEMILKPEDFVSQKINWNLKVQSINEIAAELNIGLDSFTFIDDNPVERDLVRQALPMVNSLDPNDDECWTTIERLFKYPNTQETEEARNRTKMYQDQAQRHTAINQKLDYQALMTSLGLEMTFRQATEKDLIRVYELTARTNQFNTTTRRHNESRLKEFHNQSTTAIFVAELKDKFGSLGVVAVAILTEKSSDTVEFDTLIMSCRAMGFGLENQFLHEIVSELSARYENFVGLYLPTDRNQPCASIFKQNNFSPADESEWHYQTSQADKIMTMNWIKVSRG